MATSYQEQTSGTLPEWNTQVMDLLNQGKAQAAGAYQPYGGQLTAGLTSQQQAAFNQASSSVGNWQPELNKAGQLIGQSSANPLWEQAQNAAQGAAGMDLAGIGSGLYGQAQQGIHGAANMDLARLGSGFYGQAQQGIRGAMGADLTNVGNPMYSQAQQGIYGAMGADLANVGNPMYGQSASMFAGAGQFDPNQLQQYLNPYLSGMVGEIGRLGNEQFQNKVLPGLTSAFSGLGQHGSARQAMMMSDAAARSQREILGQQATALNTGYTNAMGDYLNWAKQRQESAQGLADLGAQQYTQALGQADLGLRGSQALAGIGAQQYTQALGQADLGLRGSQALAGIGAQQYTQALGQADLGLRGSQALTDLGTQQYTQGLGQADLGLRSSEAFADLGAQQYTQGLGQANLRLGASQRFGDLANQQSAAQLAAGTGLGNLAQARQQLSIGDYGQLLNAGTIQQQQKQEELDAQYDQWNKKQQYPWEQLGNYAKLFGAGTPQQSTNWSASFKKGGLARYADGGDFRPWDQINFDTKYDQPARDELRLQLLMQELEGNPDDVDLLNEIRATGVPLEEISVMPSRSQGAMPGRRAPAATRALPSFASEIDAATTPLPMATGYGDLARRSFDERIAAYERLRNDPAMAPVGERSLMDRAARGLFAASAEGPAHWGTLLGRAGATFYGEEDARQRTNRDLAVARAGLEDKILPDVGRGGFGSAAMPGYVSVTGQDGRRFMVNRLDPNDRIEIGTGINQRALHDAADRYAREQIKDSIFKDDAEREQRYNYHKRNYMERRVGQQSRPDDRSMFPDVPGRTTPTSGGEDGKVILSPAEKAQQEKIGAAEGEEYAGIVQSGAASRSQLSTLDFLESNFDKITTGRLTPAMTEVKAWANAFGIDFEEDIAPAQAIKAISGQLALTLRNPSGGAGMPGALSDRDLQFLQSMVPQLGNDDKSNRLILDYARRIAKRNIEVSRRARKYVNSNPRKVLDEGFYDELEDWSSANPLFKEADALAETDGGREAAAPSGGRQRIKVTPEMLRGQ